MMGEHNGEGASMASDAKTADPSDPSVGIVSPGGGTACPVPGVPAVSPYGPFAQPEPAPGHLWDAGDDTAGPRGPRLVERLETDEHGDVFVWFRDGGIGGMARHMQRRWKLAGVETEHGRVMVGETRQTPLGYRARVIAIVNDRMVRVVEGRDDGPLLHGCAFALHVAQWKLVRDAPEQYAIDETHVLDGGAPPHCTRCGVSARDILVVPCLVASGHAPRNGGPCPGCPSCKLRPHQAKAIEEIIAKAKASIRSAYAFRWPYAALQRPTPCDACGEPCEEHTEAQRAVCLPKLLEENTRLRADLATAQTLAKGRDVATRQAEQRDGIGTLPTAEAQAHRGAPSLRIPDYGALRDKNGLMESLGREIDEGIEDARRDAEAARPCQRDPYYVHAGDTPPDAAAPAQPYVPQKLTRFDALAAEKSSASAALRAVPARYTGVGGAARLRDDKLRAFAPDTSIAAHFKEGPPDVDVRDLLAMKTFPADLFDRMTPVQRAALSPAQTADIEARRKRADAAHVKIEIVDGVRVITLPDPAAYAAENGRNNRLRLVNGGGNTGREMIVVRDEKGTDLLTVAPGAFAFAEVAPAETEINGGMLAWYVWGTAWGTA